MAKEKTDLVALGKRIKKARDEAGFTQYELHVKTGISITQISAYENGARRLGLQSLLKIARATGKTMDEIYEGDLAMRPIIQASNRGELIVNCVNALYEENVLEMDAFEDGKSGYNSAPSFSIYEDEIADLLCRLNDFDSSKSDYPDPENFKKQILAVAAKHLNSEEPRRKEQPFE